MKQKIIIYTLRAAIFHAIIALAMRMILLSYAPNDSSMEFADVVRYFEYASNAMNGSIPYRDYMIEYPVLALPLFLIPRLFTADIARYAVLFGIEMLLMNAAAVYLVVRHVCDQEGIEQVPARLIWYTLFFVSLCPLTIARFDLAPMTFAFAATLWWFFGRNSLGGMMAGIGVLTKFFPAVVALPALLWEVSRRRHTGLQGMTTFVLSIVAGTAFWFALGGEQMIVSIQYHFERGLEIGSLYSGILLTVGVLAGTEIRHIYAHASTQLLTPWSAQVASLTLPIQTASLLFY